MSRKPRLSRDSRNNSSKKTQAKLVCLRYIPQGENAEVEIYLDANDFPSEKHHPLPSSRRGEATEDIDPILHWAWHVLVANDVVEEVIAKIRVWQDENGQIKEEYLLGRIKEDKMGVKYDLRLLAWHTIFSKTRNANEAIEIIKKTFTKRT